MAKKMNPGWVRWSKDEIRLLKKLYKNTEAKKIAEQVGRTVGAVRRRAWELGLQSKQHCPIPLRNYSNAYFIKRLAGTAFGKIATRKEFPIVYKMLGHDYWVIRNAALEAIKKYGNTSDLELLLETAIENPTESYGEIDAICIIEDKVFCESRNFTIT